MTCPHCGYCPSCGRSGHYGSPFNPWIIPNPYPNWNYPNWGGPGVSFSGGTYHGPDFGNYQQTSGGGLNNTAGAGSVCNHLPQGEIQ